MLVSANQPDQQFPGDQTTYPTLLWEDRRAQAGAPKDNRKPQLASQTWKPMILDKRTSISPTPLSFQPAYSSGCAPAPSSPLHNDFTADPYFGNLNGNAIY